MNLDSKSIVLMLIFTFERLFLLVPPACKVLNVPIRAVAGGIYRFPKRHQ